MVQMKITFILMNLLMYGLALKYVEKEFQKTHMQVKTESGTIQGIRIKSENVRKGYYYAYLGIPYAQPPLGDLRFKAPLWVSNWSRVLDGSQEGSKCVEIYLELKGISKVTGSEDCLYLNVFSKTNPAYTRTLKPVMVFIHGGAFWLGGSDIKKYQPDFLIAKDVIVVIFNYRLNVFGFLSTEDLASPGNYGLKDQNLALRWVQRNIKYFGGDPNNVLLFGQSAGAASVHYHIISPKSKGLFHKAILQSGSALCLWGSQRKPRNIAYLAGLANGIVYSRDSQELVDKLRNIDLEDIKGTLLPLLATSLSQVPNTGLPFSPNFEPDHEDAFLTKNHWYEMLKNGDFNRVPVLMGITKNESIYFYQEFEVLQPALLIMDLDNGWLTPPAMNISDSQLKTVVGGEIKNKFIGKFNRLYSADMEIILRFVGQDQYVRPLWKTAELMSRHVPLYFYEFRYESALGRRGLGPYRQYPTVKGVAHAEDLIFIFNLVNNSPTNKTDVLVKERMTTLWTNFAKYSNPTPNKRSSIDVLGNLVWPPFESGKKSEFLQITESLNINNISENHDAILWWDKLFNEYGSPPFNTY